MQGRTRKLILWSSGTLAAVLAILLVLVSTFDLNRLRPLINEKVSAAMGRPFSIRGNIQLQWLRPVGETGWRRRIPWPEISIDDISIANPDWAGTRQFAHLKRVSIELSLLPLLQHRISIPSVQLYEPALDAERLADGRNNWTFNSASTDTQGRSAWTLDLGTLAFDKGTASISDALYHFNATLTVDPLGQPIAFSDLMAEQTGHVEPTGNTPPYAFGFHVSGNYNRASVQADGKIGGAVSLHDASVPLPLQVTATVGDTRMALAGTLTDPLHMGALDMHLKIAGSNMSHLFPLTGITLPDTGEFATAGYLHAELKNHNSTFRYQHFTGHVGDSDIAGNLLFETKAPRPRLSGGINSRLLQFQDLSPLLGGNPKSGGDQADASATLPEPQPPNKLLPVTSFRTDRWNSMDADIHFTAARITREATLPVEDVSTHIVLDDGMLVLQPFSLRTAGGTIAGTLALNGAAQPLQGNLSLQVRGLQLQQLFPKVPQMKSALGELGGDARLKAHGNSVAALAATSTGEVKLLVQQGKLSRNLLELAGLNMLNVVTGKLFGDKPVDINCAAANLVASNGEVDSRLFVVDTQDAQINVSGGINLATEKMDVDVTPRTKGMRILSLRSPLYLRGTFKQPDVGVDLRRVALKGGSAVGLGVLLTPAAALLPLISPSHSDSTPCATLIEAMRTPASTTTPGKAAETVNAATAEKGKAKEKK